MQVLRGLVKVYLKRRASLLALSACAVCACGETTIPAVAGRVVTISDNQPVSGAVVVATFTGHTRAREAWFFAHSGLDPSRCFRVIVHTDDDGNFAVGQTVVASYFGSPRWSLFAYKEGFRSALTEVTSDAGRAKLRMWPEDRAADFDSFTGETLNYAAIANPDRFRELQRNRARYLEDLLNHGIAFSCEFEASAVEREQFVMTLFQQWLSQGGQNESPVRSVACDAFASFRLSHLAETKADKFRLLQEHVDKRCAVQKAY